MNLLYNKKILVIAAHPDDELLGPGGTIHKCSKKNKCDVHILIMSKGITSRSVSDLDKEIVSQKKSISEASKILGVSKVDIQNYPDNRFDSCDLLDLIKTIEKKIKTFSPDVVLTHHGSDLNIDHRLVFESTLTAIRPLPDSKSITLMTFETPSSTEWQSSDSNNIFSPNYFNQIDKEDLKAKQLAMKKYKSELRPYPHPRSTKSLEIISRRWGTVVGVEFAEVFKIIRIINKD